MKTSRTILFSILLLLAAGAIVAKRESAIADTAAARQSQNPGSYNVGFQLSQAGNNTTWRYTITKTAARTKDLGHFIVNFGNCGDQSPTIADILSATINGVDWMGQIKASEGNTGCDVDSANFVKFDNLPSADTYVIEFTLDDIYPPVDTIGWLKSGTSCVRTALPGPGCKGYTRTSAMEADASLVGKLYTDINTYMRRFGFDYTENPNCSGGYGGHIDGVHGAVDLDSYFNRYVFRFDIHIDPVIDGNRCSSSTVDRQRNEMKSITNNSTWANGSGSNKRIQIIHSVDGANTGKGTIVDNIPLSDFEGEWVQVREEVHYTHDGFYSAKITRISDGKVLIAFKDEHIDMWRIGSSYIRSKFGIYRSLAGGRLNQNPVGQSPLLKNESLWITDFRVYEKNSNPNPGLPHE
ncbi:MAG TPA: hypothetical protein VIC84_22200 [Blastocatellia bacterium]